jgi:hypothetical protein
MTTEMNCLASGGALYDAKYNQNLPSNRHFECGFEPKKLLVTFFPSADYLTTCYYDADYSKSKYQQMFCNGAQGNAERDVADSSSITGIAAITSDGFTLTTAAQQTNSRMITYVAVG